MSRTIIQDTTTEPIETVDNRLELLKHLGEVQSTIKESITSDFVYAKLGDKDKEGVVEMTANAQLASNYYKYLETRTKIWEWNQKGYWTQRRMNQEEKNMLKKNGQVLFDNFMVRPMMTAILNRNVKDNHLVKMLAGQSEEEIQTEEEENKKKELFTSLKETFGAKNEKK